MTRADMVSESGPLSSSPAAECSYVQYPVKVSRRWREALIDAFPDLESHQNSEFYREMVQYLLYSHFREEETGLLVIPAAVVAKMAEKAVGENGFRAIDYLEAFSRDIWPLQINDHKPMVEARTLDFIVPDAIIEIQDLCVADDEKVWLVSGLPVSPSSRRKHAERYHEAITYLTDGLDPEHPAYELATWLNSQPQTVLSKVVRSNHHRMEALWEKMPTGTEHQRTWKEVVRHTIDVTADWCRLVYAAGENTARITAKGINIHLLPRAMRKAALSGCIEMDIRSSQLAIVARLWGLSKVTDFLRSGSDFWATMTKDLKVDIAVKPALKNALYSTCFGMSKQKIRDRLAFGDRKVSGIGEEAADAFMAHYLIREVLRGRSRCLSSIYNQGGGIDAFGRWLEVSRHRPAHAIMAIQAQSWELRMMLPVFEAVRNFDGAHLLSWLHDGIVVFHRDKRESGIGALLRRCKEAFDRNAASLGFVTELEQAWL